MQLEELSCLCPLIQLLALQFHSADPLRNISCKPDSPISEL
jgi:hypothetical protein